MKILKILKIIYIMKKWKWRRIQMEGKFNTKNNHRGKNQIKNKRSKIWNTNIQRKMKYERSLFNLNMYNLSFGLKFT